MKNVSHVAAGSTCWRSRGASMIIADFPITRKKTRKRRQPTLNTQRTRGDGESISSLKKRDEDVEAKTISITGLELKFLYMKSAHAH